MKIHWRILSNFFLLSIFLPISIVLTVIDTFPGFIFDLSVGAINPWLFGPAHTTRCSGVSGSSMLMTAQSQIPCLFPSRLHCHLDYRSRHCSQANFRCPKCFQVHYLHHFPLDGSQFFWMSAHSILEFILWGGLLQTQLVAEVIFLTIWMQPLQHVESLTKMPSRSV